MRDCIVFGHFALVTRSGFLLGYLITRGCHPKHTLLKWVDKWYLPLLQLPRDLETHYMGVQVCWDLPKICSRSVLSSILGSALLVSNNVW
jgi:hypothetical protein